MSHFGIDCVTINLDFFLDLEVVRVLRQSISEEGNLEETDGTYLLKGISSKVVEKGTDIDLQGVKSLDEAQLGGPINRLDQTFQFVLFGDFPVLVVKEGSEDVQELLFFIVLCSFEVIFGIIRQELNIFILL